MLIMTVKGYGNYVVGSLWMSFIQWVKGGFGGRMETPLLKNFTLSVT